MAVWDTSLNATEDAAISASPTTAVDDHSSDVSTPPEALPLHAAGALPALVAPEPSARRWAFLGMAIAVTIGFFLAVMCYWVPVHPGVDQNGYLFGGRQLAQTGTMKFAPADPVTGKFDVHQFVGRMWVGTDYLKDTERFYPKYPIGLPLLVAIALKTGGPDWGPWLVHLINPVAMTLSIFGTFLLIRTFCGSYLAILGQLVFASSPVTMFLSVDTNSHATAVFCVVWGFVGLLAWWKRGHPVVGFAAGLLLGYAVTIRYTEATLLLPLVLVIAFRLGLGGKWWRLPAALARLGWHWVTRHVEARRTQWDLVKALASPHRDWLGGGMMLLGWTIPVAGLLIYNLVAMGTPTGYDPTNESKPGASFTFDHAIDNWETTLRHLAVNGLFFLFPIAIMGMAWMFAWRRKPALVITAWIVPCLAAYTFYYWAPDSQATQDARMWGNLGVGIGFLRFYNTILPALALCGVWAMGHVTELMVRHTQHWSTRLAAYSAVPIVVFLSCAVHLHNNGRDMEVQQYSKLVMQTNVEQILEKIPEGSAIFYQDHGLFHHLQFARNFLLYDTQTYRRSFVDNVNKNVDPDDPQGLDPGRSQSMYERLKDFDQAQLDQQMREAMANCLATGHRVFVLDAPPLRSLESRKPAVTDRPRPVPDWLKRFLDRKPTGSDTASFHLNVVQRWRRVIVPQMTSERRDEKPSKPRQNRVRINPHTYDVPWLIWEITAKAPENPSPEIVALREIDATEAAKREQANAEKQAAEKARREAEQKKREEEQQRQRDAQAAAQAAAQQRQQKIREQEQSIKDAETKITQLRTAMEKAQADLATTQQQVAELKNQHAVNNDAVRRVNADRQTIEAELAKQRQEQQRLATEIDTRTKQLTQLQQTTADAEKKLAAARTEGDRLKAEADKVRAETERLRAEAEKLRQPPATRPTTAPTK